MQAYGDEDEHNNPLQCQGRPVCHSGYGEAQDKTGGFVPLIPACNY